MVLWFATCTIEKFLGCIAPQHKRCTQYLHPPHTHQIKNPYPSTPLCVTERHRERTMPNTITTSTVHVASNQKPICGADLAKIQQRWIFGGRRYLFILAGRGRLFPYRTRRTPHPGQPHARTPVPPNICNTKMFLFCPPKRKTPQILNSLP